MKNYSIRTREDLTERVGEAKKMTIERIKQQPENNLWPSFLAQINFIQDFITADNVPSKKDKERIIMGMIAAKNLEQEYPEYADVIEWVSWGFNHFEELTTDDAHA